DITPLPKTILSAITFPITLPIDRTHYLSYFLRYSRFSYFDHFFCPYLRIHWTDFAHLKDNIVGNKISYNVGHHHFCCICHISRDFLKKKTTPHKIPSSAQVRYYFDHNSGTTEPILMNFFKYAQSDSLQQCLLAFFLYLSYFSKFSQKTSETPQFDHFFANISGSNEPILLIFELSLTNKNRSLLKKDSSKSVQIYSTYRDDRRTDRRTEGNFFFSFFAYLGLDRWSAPT